MCNTMDETLRKRLESLTATGRAQSLDFEGVAARDRWVAPMEREYLVRIIKRCDGDLDKAAEEAGIHRKSLERLLRQHGLKAADFR